MLAQDPAKRPSAEEVLRAVARAASKAGLPLAAPPTSTAGPSSSAAGAAGAATAAGGSGSGTRRSL